MIIITGGISRSMDKNIDVNYVYDLLENNWTELPCLLTPRYSHCSIYFDGYLYVFGGRAYPGEEGIINSGEKLRLSLSKEQSIVKHNENKPTYSEIFRNHKVNHSPNWT